MKYLVKSWNKAHIQLLVHVVWVGDFDLPGGRNWSLHKYVFVHLQVYSVGLDHECWMLTDR